MIMIFPEPANDNTRLFFWPDDKDTFLAYHRDQNTLIAGHLGNTP